MIITLQKRNILTISKEMREALGIETGDAMDASVENGRLVLTPVAVVPRSLRLTDSGARKESEADSDIKHGKVAKFADAKSLLKELDVKK
jgi:bifunctional DNA-binding transcriptional regulator/antitoxin component of YhaV-PrlF toxin-antitoxin module